MNEIGLRDAFIEQMNYPKDLPMPYAVECSKPLFDRLAEGYYQGVTATAPGFYGPQGRILHEGCEDAEQYVSLLGTYGKKILELGSGTGRIVIPLAKAGFQVTGIEFESDMISLMEKKDYPRDRLHVVQADARHFSLDERFDVILLSCNFLNHFADAAENTAEYRCSQFHRHAVPFANGKQDDARLGQ